MALAGVRAVNVRIALWWVSTAAVIVLALGACDSEERASERVTPADSAPGVTAGDRESGASPDDTAVEGLPAERASDAPILEVLPAGRELHLRTPDGRVETIYTLDARGESVFVSTAARPGSTVDDATIVTVTQAEGMYDLRWIEISAGVPGELRLFDVPYRPTSAMTPIDDAGPTVAWAPDGGSIGWIEWSADGETTLRTVGWRNGPGTGDAATDNAAFGVGPIPAGARIRAWTATGASMSRIDVAGPDGGAWSITVERQGDGALALPPNPVR